MRRAPAIRTVGAMNVQMVDRATDAATILDAVRALAPVIAARSEEIEQARRLPLDLVAQLRDAGCFRMLLPGTARRRRGRARRPRGDGSRAGAGRRIRRLDGDARQLGPAHLRQPAGGVVRRRLHREPRPGAGRDVQPDRRGHAGGRRLPGHRTLVVRQRLPARRLAARPLLRRRRSRPPAADDDGPRRRRRDHRHLVRGGHVRHRQPRLRRRRLVRPRRPVVQRVRARWARRARCGGSRS